MRRIRGADRLSQSRELSLAIVGADHPNKRGPTRRFGIALCEPGDPIELRREPKNPQDEYAVAVIDERGIQLGYVRSERAAWLAPILDRGEEVRAVFQQATSYGCAVRIAIGGADPGLPPARNCADAAADFYPDEAWPDEFD